MTFRLPNVAALATLILLISVGGSLRGADQSPQKASLKPAKSQPPQAATSTSTVESTVESTVTPIPSATTTLGVITTEIEGDQTIVTARLSKMPEWKNITVEEHGTFLQIKLPHTQIPASGEFIDGNGPFLRKMATFQLADEDGALRLFLNQDAAKAKLATTAELLGDRLVITIDHKKLEQLIIPPQNKTPPITAEAIIAKTAVDKNIQAPSEVMAANASESPDLHAQLTKAAAFCAVMILVLIGVQFYKTKRRIKFTGSDQPQNSNQNQLKIVNSITVGPRQKLSLIQIGSQKMLIGVSQDSINLISHVEPVPRTNSGEVARSPNFAGHLQAANPNADIKLKSTADILQGQSSIQRKTITTPTPVRGGRINVGVGDEGPRDINQTAKKEGDITKLLRDRLRNLPPG